jgi:hypothetical protein
VPKNELSQAIRDQTTARPCEFEGEAALVMSRVRRAFGRMIESLPGPPRRAGDLQRILGVDKALGWQIFRVGSGADPIGVGPYVPRSGPLAKAIRAAAARGVDKATIHEVEEAAAAFEGLVARHAGDRGAFDAMARGLQAESAGQVHLKDRRAAFRANSNLWGLNAQASYSCLIVHGGQREGTEDSMLIVGHAGIQKLRPNVKVCFGYTWGVRRSTNSGTGVGAPVAASQLAVDFIGGFSTQPSPSLSTREIAPGRMESTFTLTGVGRSHALTYFVRHIARAASERSDATWWGANNICRVPSEVSVHDILIPVGWSDPSTAAVATFGNLQEVERVRDRDQNDRMPCDDTLAHLGQELDRLRTPDVPRCPEMIAEVLREAGWDATRFDLYRCVVQYPILQAGVASRVDAAAAPKR